MLAFVQGASAEFLGKSVCQDMWNKAVNNLEIGTELQVNTGPYAHEVFAWNLNIPTAKTKVNGAELQWFGALLGQYVWDGQSAINPTGVHFNQAKDNFLVVITQPGGPIEEAFKYLRKRGLLPYTPNLEDFRTKLEQIWFRSGGFQHTFVGDKKDHSNYYSGFHNWVQFALEQNHGRIQDIDYQEQVPFRSNTEPPFMKTIFFKWNTKSKSYGSTNSMFVGTSPAFEIALYTVCFIEHPGQPCKCHIGRSTVTVETRNAAELNGHADHISTAFPKNVKIEGWRCDIDAHYRTKCGNNGITEGQCKSKGCCYDNRQPNAHTCFYPSDHKCDVFQQRDRIACGQAGIFRYECKNIGCCYDNSVHPYCFKGNP